MRFIIDVKGGACVCVYASSPNCKYVCGCEFILPRGKVGNEISSSDGYWTLGDVAAVTRHRMVGRGETIKRTFVVR